MTMFQEGQNTLKEKCEFNHQVTNPIGGPFEDFRPEVILEEWPHAQQKNVEIQKSKFTKVLILIAITLLTINCFHFIDSLTNGSTITNLTDATYHLVLAGSFAICAYLTKRGNRLVIHVLAIIGAFALFYSFGMGRGFNLITLVIILTLFWQMKTLLKRGILA